jgi:release factor glutamine methyltransferase
VTVAQALARAAALGLERIDAQLLLLHALGKSPMDRAWLLAHDTDELLELQQVPFLQLCKRRADGEPLAYIVGHKEFFGLKLVVDPRVLVPRPDTETLVEWALEVLTCHPGPGSSPGFQHPASTAANPHVTWMADQGRNDSLVPRVIDLGTGSGAIALAIKKALPRAAVQATDASADALAVARENARRLSLQVEFRQASWLADSEGPYDLIVSNPPYVEAQDPHLAALTHEPLGALAAGPDGLADIRVIVAQAPARLRCGAWLLLEHGHDQAQAVRDLLVAAGFQAVSSRRDLAGIERCSGGKWLELG